MNKKSACFTGHREGKLPFSITSKDYEAIENKLKDEITELIRVGVSEFYIGGQTGIDTTCAQLIIYLKNEIQTTANLHLVIPFKGMEYSFTQRQKDDYYYVMKHADSVTYLHSAYTPNCYRDRNQYMIDRSDYLIAVWDGNIKSGTHMTINMAKRKHLQTTIIKL